MWDWFSNLFIKWKQKRCIHNFKKHYNTKGKCYEMRCTICNKAICR